MIFLSRVEVPFSVENISAGSLGYVDVSGECKNITLHAIDFGMLSLVDTYVLVLFVVAFSINMESAAPLLHRRSHRFAMLPVWRMLSSSSTCCQLLASTRSLSQP